MYENRKNFIEYIERQINKFQKTREMPLEKDDLDVLLKLINQEVSREIMDDNNLHMPLIDIIRGALDRTINAKSYGDSPLDDVKSFNRMIKYKSIIKNSPLFSKMVEDKKINLDIISDCIPSISCLITDDKLVLYSYTQDEEKTIYEIRKGSQFASIHEEKLISVKDFNEQKNGIMR